MPLNPKPLRTLRRAALTALVTLTAMGAQASIAHSAQLPGLHSHLLWTDMGPAEVNRELDTVAASGARIIRVDLGWSSLEEQGKGQYSSWYLEKIDHVVSETERRGIQILFTVTETPCWASSAPEPVKQGCSGAWWERGVQRYAPVAAGDYADVIGYLADRYRGRVAGWEVWNEPNSSYFFDTPSPVRDYAALVKAAYPAVKSADPAAKLIAGSVMHSDVDFIEGLYAHGIGGSFDAFSIHPYSADNNPMHPLDDQAIRYSFLRGVSAVDELLARHGDGDKQLWLTELGWNTSTTRNDESWRNGVSEATQAEWLELAFAQITRWSFVEAAFWYNARDSSDDRSYYLSNFGIVDHDYSPKPAFSSFQKAAAWFGGAAPPKRRGKVAISAKRSKGVLRVFGRTPKQSAVVLEAQRYRPSAERFRTVLKQRIKVDRPGRFWHRISSARLRPMRHGKWRVVAKLHGAPKRARLKLR